MGFIYIIARYFFGSKIAHWSVGICFILWMLKYLAVRPTNKNVKDFSETRSLNFGESNNPNKQIITRHQDIQRNLFNGWMVDLRVVDNKLFKMHASKSIENVYKKFILFINNTSKHCSYEKTNAYSGTLGYGPLDLFRSGKSESFNVTQCMLTLSKLEKNGISDDFVNILGGSLIIAAESSKYYVSKTIKESGKSRKWMSDMSLAGNSRFTWQIAEVFRNLLGLKFSKAGISTILLIPKALSYGFPIELHSLFAKFAPTTSYGASATIMKVLGMCALMDLSEDELLTVTFIVAQHWLTKHHNGKLERHSLLEALQGFTAFLGKNNASDLLTNLYSELDDVKKVD